MTKDEILQRTLARMHRANDASLLAFAQQEILVVQSTLEGGVAIGGGTFLPWFLLYDNQALSYTANDDYISLPDGFLTEYDEDHQGVLFVYNAELAAAGSDPWVRLVREPYGVISARYPGAADIARFYDVVNDRLYIRPKMTADRTLRFIYYARGDSLSVATTNVWTVNTPELLISELGLVLATHYVRDDKATEMFVAAVARETKRLYATHIARLEAGRQRQRGDD